VALDLNRLQRDSANWPMRAGNYAGWRYIPLQQINQTNVENLKIGWQNSTDTKAVRSWSTACFISRHQSPSSYIDLGRPGEIKWKNAHSARFSSRAKENSCRRPHSASSAAPATK
jgi:lanthanide-dependent methanol dehydrogenase